MATIASAIQYARQKCQTDSNGISDTNGLAWANDGLTDGTRQFLTRNIDAAQTQEAYTALDSTKNPGTYAWPSDMYMMKTIEVNFQDSSQNNYLPAMAVEVANLQNTSFDWLRVNQSIIFPLFDNRGDTFEIFPLAPSSSGKIRIFYYLQPTEYTATSDTIVYPFSMDYRTLGDKIRESYYDSLGESGINDALKANKQYQKRIDDLITILAPASQQPIQVQPLRLSGWNL